MVPTPPVPVGAVVDHPNIKSRPANPVVLNTKEPGAEMAVVYPVSVPFTAPLHALGVIPRIVRVSGAADAVPTVPHPNAIIAEPGVPQTVDRATLTMALMIRMLVLLTLSPATTLKAPTCVDARLGSAVTDCVPSVCINLMGEMHTGILPTLALDADKAPHVIAFVPQDIVPVA